MSIDGTICKALRVETGLTQAELAKAANVSPKTISDFEKRKTTPQDKTLNAISLALKQAGAVLPSYMPRAGGGVRWVTSGDFKYWAEADARNLQGMLPGLIGQLVRATSPKIETVDFKSEDSVFMPGWDGQVTTGQGIQYVPQGLSGWEMGCDRGITSKANSDYGNRKNDPLGLDPTLTTFVFVTPRRWKGKASWVVDRRKDGYWADVQAIDADDLEQWLMQAPHVAAWFAKKMGKYTAGVEHIHEFWKKWRERTQPNLTASIILAGRTDVRDGKLNDWLQSPSGVLAVQGETEDEAKAFLAAALETLPGDQAQSHFQRCLIISNKEAYRSIAVQPTPMVLVISDDDRDLAGAAAKLGHHVYIPLGKDKQTPHQNGLQLSILNRDEFVKALTEIGCSQEEAEDLCKETGRSLPVLQRRIGISRDPVWAKPEHAQQLIPALLVGAWNEGNENDKGILCELAGVSYPELDQTFTRWAKESDSTLRHIGSLWRHTSRLDSWRLLAPHITKSHIEKLAAVVSTVLGARDPSVDTPAKDRWRVTEKVPYSEALREGLLQTLILVATKSDDIGFQATQDPDAWSEWQIRKLLDKASEERWYSLARLLPLVSEAAPTAFLKAVEDSLTQTPPPIMKLFESGESGFGGDGSAHSGLLWALENLAWDPKYLSRVARVLGILDRLDPGGRLSNRPANSLKEIFILWLTHTHATLDQRMEAIDYLIKHEPESAWKLLLEILPGGRGISSMTHKMRWREISSSRPPQVTYHDIRQGGLAIIPRLLSLVESDVSRWCDLIGKYAHLTDKSQNRMISTLSVLIAEGKFNAQEQDQLATVLRKIISRHRQFPDSDWSMNESKIAPLAELYDNLLPGNIVDKHRWLFDDHWITLPNGVRRSEEEAIKKKRLEALQDIIDTHGTYGLIVLSEKCKEPGVVGNIAADLLPASDKDWGLLVHWLNAERPVTLAGHSFVSMRQRAGGEAWVATAIDKLSQSTDNVAAMFEFIAGLPQNRTTWERLETQHPDIREKYWKETSHFFFRESAEDMTYAVEKLLGHGRPKAAFQACRFKFEKLPSRLLMNILEQLTSDSEPDGWRPECHDIDRAFEALDTATDASEGDLVRLEWRYAQALNRYGEGRGTKVLCKHMSENPDAFVDLLKFAYKHEDEKERENEVKGISRDDVEKLARNAYSVLDNMHVIPGTKADGIIDPKVLRNWLQETRRQAEKAGRLEVCDITIGGIFAHAPKEDETIWPAYVVCEAIEETCSRGLESGFSTGIFNNRGVVTKAYNEGGRQEYELAAQFKEYTRALKGKYPRVAAVLSDVAKKYEGEGRIADGEAVARDLRN